MAIEIPLTGGYVTRIDEADKVFTDGRTWYAKAFLSRNTLYVATNVGDKTVLLHSLLAPDWSRVDHADGNGLNNCRSNLRDGSGFRNEANKGMQRNNTSGFKGVIRRGSRWRAMIGVGGKLIRLGTFGTPEEAAYAYDQAAVSYFGEYAFTNAMLGLATTRPVDRQPTVPEERTHCRRAGHEYTPENTYIRPSGRRECKQCMRIAEGSRDRRVPNPRPPGRFCPPGCTCGRHRRAA